MLCYDISVESLDDNLAHCLSVDDAASAFKEPHVGTYGSIAIAVVQVGNFSSMRACSAGVS